jgi:hypothetical protein
MGFPSDGIWLVTTKPGQKSSECILKLDEVNSSINFNVFKVLHERKDKIIEELSDLRDSNKLHIYGMTLHDFVNKIITLFSND